VFCDGANSYSKAATFSVATQVNQCDNIAIGAYLNSFVAPYSSAILLLLQMSVQYIILP